MLGNPPIHGFKRGNKIGGDCKLHKFKYMYLYIYIYINKIGGTTVPLGILQKEFAIYIFIHVHI